MADLRRWGKCRIRTTALVAVVLVAALAVPVLGAGPAAAAGTLSVSKTDGLDPAGETLSVSGAGFDVSKGIYVAFCVVPPPGQPPSPCGGGGGPDATAGASHWISSNPPSYGVGLALPYGPGGSFAVSVPVTPTIGTVDCRRVQCAVVTRNDHTRSTDRSQDVIVPVRFAGAALDPGGSGQPPAPGLTDPGGSDTTAPPAATAPPAPPPPVAPVTTLAPDGKSVSDGTRRLAVDGVAELDASGARVRVVGAGFDPARGIVVALCRIPEVPGSPPGPCGASKWISSAPPADGPQPVAAYTAGGGFAVRLDVEAVIDDTTDCSVSTCAVTTRNDFTAAGDRSQDLVVPVTFATSTSATDGEDGGAAPIEVSPTASTAGSGSGDGPWLAVAIGVAALAVAGAVFVVLRRRARVA